MERLLLILVTLLISVLANAATGHGDEGVPVALVWHQTFNVVLMLAGLIWFLRTPLRNHFKERRELFTAAAAKADEARRMANEEKSHIEAKLAKLEATAAESITRARAEAVDYRNALIKEANELAARIKADAEAAAQNEVQRAKNEIRREIITESLKATRAHLASQVSGEDHERLQTRFVEQLQAVQK